MQHTGTDPWQYARDKEEWVKSVGYEGHPRGGTISISAPSKSGLYRLLRDFGLGIIDKLPIEVLTLADHRFGIPITEFDLRNESPEVRAGYLGPTAPFSTGMSAVRISDADRGTVVSFPCRVYSSRVAFPMLPRRYWAARFSSETFVLRVDDPAASRRPKQLKMNVAFPLDPTRACPQT